MKLFSRPQVFWREACALDGSATPYVFQRILIFGGFAAFVAIVDSATGHRPEIEVAVAPYEVAGAALGLLLVLRTNAGYERWWEARKLWGGIVNRCRHLAVAAISYGPEDREWRREAVARVAAFPHAARRSLRREDEGPGAASLHGIGRTGRDRPLAVAQDIARHLRSARGRRGLDGFAFLGADRDLTALLDYFGGCERIQKTPLPRAYAILIRRFIVPFLATLPFALLPKIGWLTPLATMLIAYPILALDKIGDDLQDPFSAKSLNHLPLDAICQAIERDLLELLGNEEGTGRGLDRDVADVGGAPTAQLQ